MVSIIQSQRLSTSTIVRFRNATACPPHVVIGPLWNGFRNHDTNRPIPSPIRRANSFFHRAKANRVTATISTARPINAATTRAGAAWPVMASSASETTGSASFMRMFHTPVTPMYRVMAWASNPQDDRIER